jgi:hypothetical protein
MPRIPGREGRCGGRRCRLWADRFFPGVRVLRIRYGPHEKSVMHGHPATVGVFLNDTHFRFTYPDGKTEDGSVKAGDVMYFDAVEHLPENQGDQAFEVIAVELKK